MRVPKRAALRAKAQEPSVRGRDERVVLVDGSKESLLLEAAALAAAGFHATTTGSVAEALAALDEGSDLDAVMTDSLAPGGAAGR
jgi:DNA-binding NtrC family response regulator